MRQSNRELWMAFIAVVIITLVYLFVTITLAGVPAASGFFGHSIGVLGFILMLMTETLYTIRKRSRRARWGKMSSWLDFHIFTGIVGPFMVLLHTSWKFNGLAGIALLLTIIIVASGFIGRYIYTAVPRTADGITLEADEIKQQILAIGAEMEKRGAPPNAAASKQVNRQIKQLVRQQQRLRRQLGSLATARRMLALWHAVHIPIGMVLFTSAFIHAGAAFYYATLLR